MASQIRIQTIKNCSERTDPDRKKGDSISILQSRLIQFTKRHTLYIVEFEQEGADRAKYGTRLLATLAGDLAAKGAKGLGFTTLKTCRLFFQTYPAIGQAVLDQLAPISAHPNFPHTDWENAEAVGGKLPTPLKPAQLSRISWAHFIQLTRINDPWKWAFYENECLRSHWSVRQPNPRHAELARGSFSRPAPFGCR